MKNVTSDVYVLSKDEVCFIVRWCFCFIVRFEMNTERITTKEEEDMEKLLPQKSRRLGILCDVKLKIKDNHLCWSHWSQNCLSGIFLTRAHKSSKFKLISDKSDSIIRTSFIFMVWSMMFLYSRGYIMTDSEICCFITETLD